MLDRRGFIAAAGAATAIASTRLAAQVVADDRIYGYPGPTRPFGPDVYRERRARLLSQMKDGVAVIYGPREIDLGYARVLCVRITYVGELEEFSVRDRVCAKGMDDRLGVAILIQLLVELAGVTPYAPVLAVATVLEQVGLRGASMAAHRLEPDYAIAIDGLSAGDTPDSSTTRDLPVVMGRGPVVLLAASTNIFRGSIAHPAMKRYLLSAAESERKSGSRFGFRRR